MEELTYYGRKRIHNLKYFTWVEQQGRTVEELRQLWDRDFWTETFAAADAWDQRIEEFNALAGHEEIHKGMTSRDLTENVEQLQVRAALELVRDRMVAALVRLGRLAAERSLVPVMIGMDASTARSAQDVLLPDPALVVSRCQGRVMETHP